MGFDEPWPVPRNMVALRSLLPLHAGHRCGPCRQKLTGTAAVFFSFFFFFGYVANQEKGGLRGEENEHNTFGYVRERNAKNLWHDWSNFLCTHMILSNKVGVRPPCASVFSSISWSFSAAFSTGRLWWFPVVYSHVAARFCRV